MRHTILFRSVLLVVLLIFVSISTAGLKSHFSIDLSKCKINEDCEECIYECPEEVIIESEKDGKRVLVIDAEKCTDCEICFEICPEDAIFRDTTEIAGYDPLKDPNLKLSKADRQKTKKKKGKKKK